MAGDLIDQYLVALRGYLAGGATVDNLVAETSDHLRTTADALIVSGMAAQDAQREAVRRFGDPRAVARQMRAAGLGEASPFTRFAGGVGVAASASNLALLAGSVGLLNWAMIVADIQVR